MDNVAMAGPEMPGNWCTFAHAYINKFIHIYIYIDLYIDICMQSSHTNTHRAIYILLQPISRDVFNI